MEWRIPASRTPLETTLSAGVWIAAFAPVAVLLALVTSGRVKARTAAVVVAALSVVLGATVFRSGPEVLGVALAKGAWLGLWILAVVWPAMLLYQLASRAGLNRLGAVLSSLFPNEREKLLVLAWVLPAFVQGVAGFGTPIAVAAPLLVTAGWQQMRAVIYPLLGYHWAVTFGSMGSSFYIAALTAHLDPGATERFARGAAFLLSVNGLAAGLLILALDGGLRGVREGSRMLLCAGLPMLATLYFVAPVVPALGSVTAGTAGLVGAFALVLVDRLRARAAAPAATVATRREDWRTAWVTAPYFYLVGAALAVFLVPASRQWVSTHFVIGPSFPATATGRGIRNAASSQYTPFEVFGHPGTYLLFACVLGYVTYRATRRWPRGGGRGLAGDWLRSVGDTSLSIVALACVATVLRDTGMIETLARGLVAAAGQTYPYFAALIGAIGSFLTGSSASSNALFAVLQTRVAGLIDVPAPVLLAAQVSGANVGNSLALVVVLIGLNSVGAGHQLARVVRAVALLMLLLLAVVTGMTMLLLAVGPLGA